MALPGGPTFDPQAAAAVRQKTQRRRALGAVALVVGAAAIGLFVQGRRAHSEPESSEPGGPSISTQLHEWAEQSGPRLDDGEISVPFVDLYGQAERDVKRALKATEKARRSLEQAEDGGVDPRRLDPLREMLEGEPDETAPVLSTERAL